MAFNITFKDNGVRPQNIKVRFFMKQANHITKFLRIIFLILVAGMIVYYLFNRDRFSVESIVDIAPSNLLLACLMILFLYALKSICVFFPVMVLQASTGLLFPTGFGLLVNTAGCIVMATVPYWLSRKAASGGMDAIYKKYPALELIIEKHRENELFLCFFLRIMGFLPIDIVSALLGMMKVSYIKYLCGSLLGMAPGIIAITFLGGSISDPKSPEFLISIASTVLISLVSLIVYIKTTGIHVKDEVVVLLRNHKKKK